MLSVQTVSKRDKFVLRESCDAAKTCGSGVNFKFIEVKSMKCHLKKLRIAAISAGPALGRCERCPGTRPAGQGAPRFA
jgi:hypothetical protein